ncbi:MAG: hypothetical protein VXY56_12365, partial [Pseudomonadota bacterium]|nr:hypothetical protein [Pseudomonadota bacterium]
PIREFKFKLKLISYEENDRFRGNFSGNTNNRSNGNFHQNARDRYPGNPTDNSRRVSAIQADEHISRERSVQPLPEAYEEDHQAQRPVVREFKRSTQSGNDLA